MPDDPTEPPPRSTAEIDAGWGALLDGIGHSGPLVVDEPMLPTASAVPQLVAAESTLPPARELSLPVDDPEPPIAEPEPPIAEPEPPIAEPAAKVEEAPRMLEVADAVPRPISTTEESWPRRDPVEIVARASGSHRVVRPPSVAPKRATTAELEPTVVRSRWQLFAGATVIVAAIGWFATRPSEETAKTSAVATASSAPRVEKTPDAPKKPAPVLADPPRVEAKAPSPPPPVEAKAPAEVPPVDVKADAEAKPAAPVPAPTPAPETTETAILGTSSDLLAEAITALDASKFALAHGLADRAWHGERTNDAVRVMTLAACQIPDGVLARGAFRKLDGPLARKEAYSACKRNGVDLRAKTDGYTANELLAMARREAAAGNHEKAYEHAKASNRVGKSADALQLMAESACNRKDEDAVAYLMGMLPRDRKTAVEAVCTSAGTPLPAAK
jgi:hypothetical protein